jgi:hypothetical protein
LFRVDRLGHEECYAHNNCKESNDNINDSVFRNRVRTYQESDAGKDGSYPEKSCEKVDQIHIFHMTFLDPKRPGASEQGSRIEIRCKGYLPDMIPNAGLHPLKDGIDYE